MDKETFITALIEMYQETFTEGNTQMWIEAYSQVLPEKIDFQELFDDMLVNYNSTKYAPSTAFFKPYVDKQLERIKLNKQKAYSTQQFEQWKKEREEATRYDKPMTEPLLTPVELLKRENAPYDYRGYFSQTQMQLFKNYVKTITMENLRIKFWQQVAQLIMGGKNNELCRNVQEVCS